MLIGSVLFFTTVLCACKEQKVSIIFYSPESIKELKSTGYKFNEMTGSYDKWYGDTLVMIHQGDNPKEFKKSIYVRRSLDNKDSITADSLNLFLKKILDNHTGEIILKRNNFSISSVDKDLYFIGVAFSGKGTFYIINAYNLAVLSDRNLTLEYLNERKSFDTTEQACRIIDSAIRFIKKIDAK
jgi:hypothetical protein